MGTILGVALRAIFFSSAASSVLGRLGRLQGTSAACAGHLLIGLLLEPLRPLGRLGRQQFFQVDRGRGTVRLRRLDGDGAALGDLEVEAHHRLVDLPICSTSSVR